MGILIKNNITPKRGPQRANYSHLLFRREWTKACGPQTVNSICKVTFKPEKDESPPIVTLASFGVLHLMVETHQTSFINDLDFLAAVIIQEHLPTEWNCFALADLNILDYRYETSWNINNFAFFTDSFSTDNIVSYFRLLFPLDMIELLRKKSESTSV